MGFEPLTSDVGCHRSPNLTTTPSLLNSILASDWCQAGKRGQPLDNGRRLILSGVGAAGVEHNLHLSFGDTQAFFGSFIKSETENNLIGGKVWNGMSRHEKSFIFVHRRWNRFVATYGLFFSFFSTSIYTSFPPVRPFLPLIFADWLSQLGLGNQLGSTTDHL